MNKKKYISFFCLLLFIQLAQPTTNAQSIDRTILSSDTIEFTDDLFSNDEPIELIIRFDIKNFQKTRSKEEYHPAELTWIINDSLQKDYNVRLRTRGIFRKNHCYLPPFWLNIKNSGIHFPPGEKITKMKMVTHCNKSKDYNNYILKEYLTYKIYNQTTPLSFKVRLVRMTYIDTGRENKKTIKWAFLIEPNCHLVNRLDGVIIESDKLSMSQMNAREMDRLAHFQYMIGNVDYSISGQHNIKIIQLNSHTPSGKIPIPYDFDFTGIVNTSYATPSESINISNVRERYFLGPCRSDNMHQLAIDKLLIQKNEILDLISSFEYLSENQRNEMLNYIESYYSIASKDTFIEWKINISCR